MSAIGIYNENILIGCLTIHLETAYFENFISVLSHFIATNDSNFLTDNQRFDSSKVENSLEKIVSQYKLENNLGLEKLKKVHKKEIITQLVEQGYLARKGAITKIGHVLSLSRPTIYRYIKAIIKNNKKIKQNSNIVPERLAATLTF